MVGFVVNIGALLTWYDRRGGAMMQDRIGPNRAGFKIFGVELRIAGLLHTAADGLKFFTKKDFLPPKADKLLFSLAPIISLFPVVALCAVIPFGDTIVPESITRTVCKHGTEFKAMVNGACPEGFNAERVWPAVSREGLSNLGTAIRLQIAPLNVGILYVFAIAGQGIVGAAIAGWASDNKFSLMGALRAASQMVSYEVTLGLTLVGAFMVYGSVRLEDMVLWQDQNCWGIFVQPLAFFLFFAAAIAETKRIPFDLPEAESELVSGYFTEYSGMKFGMFYFSEYMEVATSSMLLVLVFLGGWHMPFLHRDGITIAFGTDELWHTRMPHIWVIIFGVLTFFGKTIFICWIQAFIRWSLPRFRYDQLMKLGWTVLLPASLANIFATGIVWLALQSAGPGIQPGLKTAADLVQGFTAVVIIGLVGWGILGFLKTPSRNEQIIGSSAKLASAAGGAKEAPISA
ncbi:MAG: NADH-quinone oxidoreductase subunit H [Labilithrix sp.]|nr:NADH-quinone oxidoreductase subunit H [Labilithrix sp.]MCW5814317.1 NADH-quinone oxidoreductase subunit H [Labilithrix sp.]